VKKKCVSGGDANYLQGQQLCIQPVSFSNHDSKFCGNLLSTNEQPLLLTKNYRLCFFLDIGLVLKVILCILGLFYVVTDKGYSFYSSCFWVSLLLNSYLYFSYYSATYGQAGNAMEGQSSRQDQSPRTDWDKSKECAGRQDQSPRTVWDKSKESADRQDEGEYTDWDKPEEWAGRQGEGEYTDWDKSKEWAGRQDEGVYTDWDKPVEEKWAGTGEWMGDDWNYVDWSQTGEYQTPHYNPPGRQGYVRARRCRRFDRFQKRATPGPRDIWLADISRRTVPNNIRPA
jgi:hypothetical protein